MSSTSSPLRIRSNKRYLFRALRLPFCSASILPFILGSLLALKTFHPVTFLLGLGAVLATHLWANLLNDYADSLSGADWIDRRFFGFFGGSKLIQEGKLTEKWYRDCAFFFFFLALACILLLSLLLKSPLIITLYLVIVILAFGYSYRPFQFAYRRLGELIIFILFGPVPVMGGYFIQTGIFPTMEGFLFSLCPGLLTTAILFANEVPDYNADMKALKRTWVSILGNRQAFMLYGLLIFLAFLSVLIVLRSGYAGILAYLSLLAILPSFKAMLILKKHYQDKARLVESSRLTIMAQSLAVIFLILGVAWRRI